jgi:hypothetical protein
MRGLFVRPPMATIAKKPATTGAMWVKVEVIALTFRTNWSAS